jgi:hypothetical protein
MKAEHRKELQTNVLADRMGRLVQRMKQRPKRRVLLYLILGAAAIVVILIFLRIRETAARERSELWVMFEDGFPKYLENLKDNHRDVNPGKAANFEYAWALLWDFGLKNLGSPGRSEEALKYINGAEGYYTRLAQECADDPVWEPEALYGLAIIEETRAIRAKDRGKHLANAQERFKTLASKHKDSAFGKLAKKRAEQLEKNGPEINRFYDDLQLRLGILEERLDFKDFKLPKVQ